MVSFQLFVTLALISIASALQVDKNTPTSEVSNTRRFLPRANGIAQGVVDTAGPGDGALGDTTSLILHSLPDTSVNGLAPKVVEGLTGLERRANARSFGLLNTVQAVGSGDTGVGAIKMGTMHSSTNGLTSFERRGNGILQAVTGSAGVDPISGDPVEQSTETNITGMIPKGAVKTLVDDLVAPGSKRDTVPQERNIDFINGALSNIRVRQILNDAVNSIGNADQGATANAAALVGGIPSFPPREVPAVVPALDAGNTNTHSDADLIDVITAGSHSTLANSCIQSSNSPLALCNS